MQVAFSGAEEFLKNYEGDEKGGIIGHFGLGFYSAFMVADRVTIETLSGTEGASPVQVDQRGWHGLYHGGRQPHPRAARM